MLSTVQVILPAAIIVAAGFITGRRVLDARGIKALSDLVYMLFLPCLLFRSMATAEFDDSAGKLLLVYFGGSLLWFFAVALVLRRRPTVAPDAAVVLALGVVFSNTVQLGIPIQRLAYGDAGLKLHLSIIALHSLIILVAATVWLELVRARQAQLASDVRHSLARQLLQVVKSAVIHPVILPILGGLLWSAMDWPLPQWADQPLGFLASASGPIMLVLMGAQLSTMRLSEHLRPALLLTVAQNLLHPALIFALAWAVGLPPLAMAVAVTCAALPIGSNVFIFAQRYNNSENTITAATAVSSVLALFSLTLIMTLLPKP